MTSTDRFSTAALGLDEADQRVLKTVLDVSRNRTPTFYPYRFDPATPADVVLVNADSPRAVNGWRAYQRLHGSSAAVVFAGGGGDTGGYRLRRPLMATRLLAMLERVATEELGYAPALAIEAEESPAAGAAAAGAEQPARLRALVVDDSLPVRTQMKLALRDVATHVDFAENSDEAEAFIRGGRYDVVFLDVILPGKDGYELCRMIKQDAETRDTSVIMLTSNSSPADRIKGKLAGCDTYLIKPVRNAVFQEVLGELADTMGGTGRPSGGAAQAGYGPAWRASHSNA